MATKIQREMPTRDTLVRRRSPGAGAEVVQPSDLLKWAEMAVKGGQIGEDVFQWIEKQTGEEDRRVFPYTISDSSVDRHDDTVDIDGWVLDYYNGTVLFGHSHGTPAIAQATKVWKYGGKLKSIAAFTRKDEFEFGHMIGKLVEGGFIKDASVGFHPLEFEVNEERTENDWWPALDFKKQELIEWSVVNVGSNRNTSVNLMTSLDEAREAGIDTTAASKFANKMLQEGTMKGWIREVLEEMYAEFQAKDQKFFLPPEIKSGDLSVSPARSNGGPVDGEAENSKLAEFAKEVFRG